MGYKLVAIWNNKIGNDMAHNVWKVTSDIEFVDGRARFTISNGSNVDIGVEQLETIMMVETDGND